MAFALDHVQIAIPPGSETEAPGFYGTRLGLRELDRPAILAGRSGCWYDLGLHQLHLGADADFHPARKAHVALTTDDLAALRIGFRMPAVRSARTCRSPGARGSLPRIRSVTAWN
ncbi:hypothetical protein [Sphingomonas sp. CARO-RG-8B-R24-01]|uniref:hypothetical protein n=1 Tax=Sphingomonas sp. CARO-RG-8B-R24-01 TaxID=2914831 RepID=UPI001F595216|nr:hypothetical protein [Sphingomonas sp. CARO-RG-8B-R24-01]